MFNLRGNQRTSGELSRKEGGKIFGSGSRTPISITILVRKPNHAGSAAIHYEAVADYLSREEKLALVGERGSMLSDKMSLSSIAPNQAGDWINQRDGLFETFIPIGDKEEKSEKTFFVPFYSRGVATAKGTCGEQLLITWIVWTKIPCTMRRKSVGGAQCFKRMTSTERLRLNPAIYVRQHTGHSASSTFISTRCGMTWYIKFHAYSRLLKAGIW